jgi:hypothetical protein
MPFKRGSKAAPSESRLNLLGAWRDEKGPGFPARMGLSSQRLLNITLRRKGYMGEPPGFPHALRVVVQVELPGVGSQCDLLHLSGELVLQPGLDHVGREDVTLEQEIVVHLQGGKRFAE